jgi:hypothetical protein
MTRIEAALGLLAAMLFIWLGQADDWRNYRPEQLPILEERGTSCWREYEDRVVSKASLRSRTPRDERVPRMSPQSRPVFANPVHLNVKPAARTSAAEQEGPNIQDQIDEMATIRPSEMRHRQRAHWRFSANRDSEGIDHIARLVVRCTRLIRGASRFANTKRPGWTEQLNELCLTRPQSWTYSCSAPGSADPETTSAQCLPRTGSWTVRRNNTQLIPTFRS